MRAKIHCVVFAAFFSLCIWGCTAGSRDSQAQGSADLFSAQDGEYLDLIKRGDEQLAAGNADEALKTFEKAAGKQPGLRWSWISHNRLGRALSALGRYDEALSEFQAAHAIMETPVNHINWMNTYLFKGDSTNALVHARRWAEMEPGAADAHRAVGMCSRNLGLYAEAIAAYKKAISLQDNAQNHIALGQVYFDQRNYQESLKSFERASELDPSTVYLLYLIKARIHEDQGNLDEAITEVTKSVEMAPNEQEKSRLKHYLSDLYVAKGDYQKAYYVRGQESSLGIQISKTLMGMKVVRVMKNGPADLAGIQSGDVIVEFEGQPLANVEMNRFVNEMVRKSPFGGIVKLKIERNGQYLEKHVVAGITPNLPELAGRARAEAAKAAKPAGMDRPSVSLPFLQIAHIAVNPPTVPPGGKFDVIVDYSARDSTTQQKQIAVTLMIEILQGEKVIYSHRPITVSGANGGSTKRKEPLTGSKKAGAYTVKATVKYGESSAVGQTRFTIQ